MAKKSAKMVENLFQEYGFGKQTLKQFAGKYGKTKKTIQKYLDKHQETYTDTKPVSPVVIGIDCTFFGQGYAIIVARCPAMKMYLCWKKITTEKRRSSKKPQAVILDVKHGIKEVFSDRIIQICQYHQQQIVGRYLTTRPKTEEIVNITNIFYH